MIVLIWQTETSHRLVHTCPGHAGYGRPVQYTFRGTSNIIIMLLCTKVHSDLTLIRFLDPHENNPRYFDLHSLHSVRLNNVTTHGTFFKSDFFCHGSFSIDISYDLYVGYIELIRTEGIVLIFFPRFYLYTFGINFLRSIPATFVLWLDRKMSSTYRRTGNRFVDNRTGQTILPKFETVNHEKE